MRQSVQAIKQKIFCGTKNVVIIKNGLFILFLFSCCACAKEIHRPADSYVFVKFIEAEEYCNIEYVAGNWNYQNKTVALDAEGYKFEKFKLAITQLTDTGYYTNLTTSNLYFSESQDFIPTKFISGGIHITYADSVALKGDFQVVLEDSVQGMVRKIIIGNFGINHH